MDLDLTDAHAGHRIKTVPSRTVASMLDGGSRESIKWIEYCVDCEVSLE